MGPAGLAAMAAEGARGGTAPAPGKRRNGTSLLARPSSSTWRCRRLLPPRDSGGAKAMPLGSWRG
eukprot:3001529-Alexandrium_andersonii.AAC.1